MYYDLLELKRLKEVYECAISFSTFQTLTSDGICHKILQNALTNPNTTHQKIEMLVVPFMTERHLDQVQTIVNYIQKMSGAAVTNANVFGWEKQCVQLSASLRDETRRCCSIISIASTAKIPWPVELNEAVDKILTSRTLLRSEIEEMQMVCKRTELYKMLSSYGYRRHDIELLTLPDSNMDIIMTIRCMLAQREKASRFVDIINLLYLLKVYLRSDRERVRTISLIFSFIEHVADTHASGENVEERAKMLGIGEELLSYYKDETRAMLLSDFNDEVWQRKFLMKLMKLNASFTVRLNKSSYMGIPTEYLLEMVMARSIAENDIDKLIDTITDYAEYVHLWTVATREMLEPIVQTRSWITFRLSDLLQKETDVARADYIAFVIRRLGRVVHETLRRFPFETISDELDYLLQLEAFFNLGEHIITQSLRGQENDNE
ncbi:unnamed protein product [Caenorhabditis brenneri]